MSTFLLRWNPDISSFTTEDFYDFFCFNDRGIDDDVCYGTLNWSVWDHEKAHAGDRFFMCLVGDHETAGIVMSGRFASEPYQDEDWSGKGRRTFYMDLSLDFVTDIHSAFRLPIKELADAMPHIDWEKGHSGVMLDEGDALSLEKLWYNKLKRALGEEDRALLLATIAHHGQTDKAGKPYIMHPLRVASSLVDDQRIAALLHDVVEDSAFTLLDLTREGFKAPVVEAVKALTRNVGEDYEAYIRRLCLNPMARKVKLSDLRDNMDITRWDQLPDDLWPRLKKYHKAYIYVREMDKK